MKISKIIVLGLLLAPQAHADELEAFRFRQSMINQQREMNERALEPLQGVINQWGRMNEPDPAPTAEPRKTVPQPALPPNPYENAGRSPYNRCRILHEVDAQGKFIRAIEFCK